MKPSVKWMLSFGVVLIVLNFIDGLATLHLISSLKNSAIVAYESNPILEFLLRRSELNFLLAKNAIVVLGVAIFVVSRQHWQKFALVALVGLYVCIDLYQLYVYWRS